MSAKPNLWTAIIPCPPTMAEPIVNALEEDSVSVTLLIPPRSKKAQVEAIFAQKPKAAQLKTKLAILAKIHKAKTPTIQIKKVGSLNWLKKVAADFPPLPIARWTIYGGAHKKAVKGNPMALQIDATSAFGTGEHPTTQGCLKMLDWLLKKKTPANMLDLGCGSGILAMAFAKATKGKATAVDFDPQSVKISKQNVRLNKLEKQVRVAKSDGYQAAIVKKNAPYDLIMANIFADPLCKMAKDLKRNLCTGGVAILSGILNTQAKAVLLAHEKQGLKLLRRQKNGEWSVLVLERTR